MKWLCLLAAAAAALAWARTARAEFVREAWRGGAFVDPVSVSVNTEDGSCWVADFEGSAVAHLREDGTELWRGGESGWLYPFPTSVSVNTADSSCWVAGGSTGVTHLAADGTGLLRLLDVGAAAGSVAPSDGSYWVHLGGAVARLAEDGTELSLTTGFCNSGDYWQILSVNPADGSCWAGAYVDRPLAHLAANGNILWSGGEFADVMCVSANPRDGSCWVGAEVHETPAQGGETAYYVIHLAEDGTELWRGQRSTENRVWSVCVNAADGSCWVAKGVEVVHLGANGAELWHGPGFGNVFCVSPNSADGSCWVADRATREIIHLVIPGWQASLFYDVPWYHWSFDAVGACSAANIVKGYDDGLYHPEGQITRDQMAVYVARALVSPSGDAAIPDPTPPPAFSDVPPTHWAYKHIEYAVSQNVVQGYEDGTYGPDITLDRGQMAVFIARAMVAPGGDAAIPEPVPPATFPDVASTFWGYKQVEYCVGQDVVKGYDDGLYHPDYPCTRDQMAVYIARAFGLL